MSKEKLARRKAMGDDPTAIKKSETSEAGKITAPNYGRPIPGADQSHNVDLNPMVARSMGGGQPTSGSFSGRNDYPYMDGGIPSTGGPTGSVGFAQPSNQIQNQTPGRGLNSKFKYGEIMGPADDTGMRLEPFYMQKQAAERSQKLYGNEMPPYEISLMGPLGSKVDSQKTIPGQFPQQMPQQMENYLGLTGTPDAAAGMNTGTGSRNKIKTKKLKGAE